MSTALALYTGATVPERGIYEVPTLRAWRQYIGVGRPELAQLSGVSHPLLVAAEAHQRMRGHNLNRVAAVMGVPAPILLAYGPLDRRARQWSTKAAMAFAERRLGQLESAAS